MRRRLPSSLPGLIATVVLAGCSSGAQSLPYMAGGAPIKAVNATGAGKITHVVYIVQENRSFDNLFHGYPGADTVDSGKISNGKTVKLLPVPLSDQYVIDHSAQAMFAACHGTGTLRGTDCRMDGFNKEENYEGPRGVKYPEYVYVPQSDSKPILRYGARMGARRPDVSVALGREFREPSVHHRGTGRLERGPAVRPVGLRRRLGRRRCDDHARSQNRGASNPLLRLSNARRRTR